MIASSTTHQSFSTVYIFCALLNIYSFMLYRLFNFLFKLYDSMTLNHTYIYAVIVLFVGCHIYLATIIFCMNLNYVPATEVVWVHDHMHRVPVGQL